MEAEPEATPSAPSAAGQSQGRGEGETELTEIKVVDAAAAAAVPSASASAKVAPAPPQQLPLPRLLAAAMVPYSAERLASGMLLMQVCPGLVRLQFVPCSFVVWLLPRSHFG